MEIKVDNLYKFSYYMKSPYSDTIWKVLEEPKFQESYCKCVCVSPGRYYNEISGWCIIDGWFEPYSDKSNNFKEIYNILIECEN
jgi:hypothetical protein